MRLPRAAAQLVVDAAGLVALGADDAQAARLEHLLLLGGAGGAGVGQGALALLVGGPVGVGVALLVELGGVGVEPAGAQQVLGQHVGVAAQHDVGAAAGHVGGDGDGAELAGLGHDLGFLIVVLGV